MVWPEVIVNYLAILVSAIVVFVVGGFWYSPLLFGNIWMKLMGFSDKDLKKAKEKGMTKAYIINFIAALIMVWILAYFVKYVGASDWVGGVQAGFWIWLGFFATQMIGGVLWEGKPVKLYVLNTGYYLVALMIAGAILAVW